ncbi:MAG TPA: VOC family protein [Chitinophagaceae bacterium]|nr:VOC family protein [Chitinophagaceae bacterium]
MKNNIYPCLWFDNQSKAAAQFYCSLFDGARITTDTPMTVLFEIYGKKIMALNGGPMFKINPAISFFVLCENIDKTNWLWEKLAEGGHILMPIDQYQWSERYGWVQDKFGMTWQISVVEKAGDTASLTPSLLFTDEVFGKGESALNYYASIFKNPQTHLLVHYPDGDENAGKLMYASVSLNDYPMILMDGPGKQGYTFNEGVSLVVDCDGQDEVDYYWNHLTADGGKESMCGWLKDKFGVSWQIVPKQLIEALSNQDKERAGQAMQAMLKMKKIVIADL